MQKYMNSMFYKNIYLVFIALYLVACGNYSEKKSVEKKSEDIQAKNLLQGIWVDDGGDNVQFRATGDSIFYPGQESRPLYFKINDGELIICGTDTVAYRIERLEKNEFWYHSITDELIKLHRSEYELDSLEFENILREPIALYDGVVKKDSVVIANGHRYRGYVYINPSKMRVFKTSYNENGMKIERAFYDNVIHICIYEGRKSLYAKDFTKKDFASIVDDDFLQCAVLGDMDFIGVNNQSFWYEASLCIPDEASCYQIYIQIDENGELSLHKTYK